MIEEQSAISQSQPCADAKSARTEVELSASHTPGPWSDRGDGIVVHGMPNSDGYRQPIKLISPWIEGAWDGDAEAEANARLIAAAPDGLAAAKALTAKYVARDFPQYMRGDWLALEAFVAKAEGRS